MITVLWQRYCIRTLSYITSQEKNLYISCSIHCSAGSVANNKPFSVNHRASEQVGLILWGTGEAQQKKVLFVPLSGHMWVDTYYQSIQTPPMLLHNYWEDLCRDCKLGHRLNNTRKQKENNNKQIQRRIYVKTLLAVLKLMNLNKVNWILSGLRPPWGSVELIFPKLKNLVLLEQSHYKPVVIYGEGPLKLPLRSRCASSAPLKQHAITHRRNAGPNFVPLTISDFDFMWKVNE